MAVNCQTCGVSMSVAEVTHRPGDNKAGNWHTDCALLSQHSPDNGINPAAVDDGYASTFLCAREKLANKRAGIATDFP